MPLFFHRMSTPDFLNAFHHVDWVGTTERNQFTYNALTNLEALTGSPPKIRVGANSEDHTTWSPTVTVSSSTYSSYPQSTSNLALLYITLQINEDEFPPPNSVTPYPEATKITVGDEYYTLVKYLPAGTQMTWGVNLGANNATNAVNMAKSILRAFASPEVEASGVKLDLIEVGTYLSPPFCQCFCLTIFKNDSFLRFRQRS